MVLCDFTLPLPLYLYLNKSISPSLLPPTHTYTHTHTKGGNGYEEMHRYIKQGEEFCKEMEGIVTERYIVAMVMFCVS